MLLLAGMASGQPCEQFTLFYGKTKAYNFLDKAFSIGIDYKHSWAERSCKLIIGINEYDGYGIYGGGSSPTPALASIQRLEIYGGIGKSINVLTRRDRLCGGLTLNFCYAEDVYAYRPTGWIDGVAYTETHFYPGGGIYLSYFFPVFKGIGIEGAARGRVLMGEPTLFLSYNLGLSFTIPNNRKANNK